MQVSRYLRLIFSMQNLTNPTTSIFHSLNGKWMLDRQINDKLSQTTGKAAGFATFSPKTSDELEYVEEIEVKWSNGMEHPATKHYKYVLKDDAMAQYNPVNIPNNEMVFEKMYDLVFHYEDGKLKAKGDFLCGCDMYNAEYIFDSLKKFRLSYNVKGKSKDYETYTIFLKCSE